MLALLIKMIVPHKGAVRKLSSAVNGRPGGILADTNQPVAAGLRDIHLRAMMNFVAYELYGLSNAACFI